MKHRPWYRMKRVVIPLAALVAIAVSATYAIVRSDTCRIMVYNETGAPLSAVRITELVGANQLLAPLLTHANQHEIHRELGQTPNAAHQQALAEKRSVIRPAPNCSWWPYVWSQQTRVRVGDDGKVPVGDQRLSIAATPRTTVIRCLRPDGDIYYLRFAPDPKAKPIVLLHVPVF